MHPFFLSLAPPATLADPGEAWELWQLEVSGGGNWEKQLVEVAEELEEEVEGVKLGGLFTSVFGPIQVALTRNIENFLLHFGIFTHLFRALNDHDDPERFRENRKDLFCPARLGLFYGNINCWILRPNCKQVLFNPTKVFVFMSVCKKFAVKQILKL